MEILSEELYDALQEAAQRAYDDRDLPTDNTSRNLQDLAVIVQATSKAGTEAYNVDQELEEVLGRVWHLDGQVQQIILAHGSLFSYDPSVSGAGRGELHELGRLLQSGNLTAILAVRLLLRQRPDLRDKLSDAEVPVELADDAE